MNRWPLVVLGMVLTLTPVSAQPEKPKPGDEMMHKYLSAEADRISKKILDGVTTRQEWEQRRPRLKQEYLYMLGLWPLPEKTPLQATITGTLEHGKVVIDKLHFQSRPGLYVTANLYRPKGNKGKLPTILYVCGHSGRGRDGNKSAFQDHGLWFASNGYNCLILDTLQLGEIPGIHHGTYGRPYLHFKAYGIKDKDVVEMRWWWQAAGYTPAGVECWNGVRALDYLCSRPDVDTEKLGITGISGGGAATGWIAAADERVKVVVPVSGWTDLDCLVKQKVINGHCDCMFHINTYQWEPATILGLIAPRPMLFANSDNDRIFPMDGNRRIFATLQKLYRMYDRERFVQEYVSKGGHDYRPDLRLAIFDFFNQHLKGVRTEIKDADFPKIDGPALRVFPTEADLPKDALNLRIDEMFVARAKVELPAEGKFADWKKKLMTQLRDQCFRALPPTTKAVQGRIAGVFEQSYRTEGEIEVREHVVKQPKIPPPMGTLVVLNVEDQKEKVRDWWAVDQEEGLVSLLEPRGIGASAWTKKSPPNYVERSHALLGSTVDTGRVHDILALVRSHHEAYLDWHKGKPLEPVRWKLVGKGQAGILCAYAALLEPSIKEVVIIDPPRSHLEGPIFLNVLRVLDIPEALGMLAPNTRLTLINARDAAFERTMEIYRRAGAADRMTRK